MPNLVTVFGATGAQGGSVLTALVDAGFEVRAVTRDTQTEKARKLAAKTGVTVVAADSNDASTFAKGTGVFDGAWGAYIVTNFWDPASMGKELAQGTALIDAAAAAGVKHVQFSSLANCEKISGGTLKVAHFTDKAKVQEYAMSIKSKFETLTFPSPAFYYQNLLMFSREVDGVTMFAFPNMPITAYDVSDTGLVVAALFANPHKYDGLLVPCAADHFYPQELVDKMVAAGKKAAFHELTIEQVKAQGFPGAEEIGEMYDFFMKHTYYGPGGKRELGVRLAPGLKDLDAWLATNPFVAA